MLHRHVEAFFYHRVLIRNVGAGSNLLIGSWLVDIAIDALVFESTLASIEDNCILKMTVSWLTESRRPATVSRVSACNGQIFILTRSWNIEFKTLAIEDLV